ncbi:hypothetical protein GOBAR_DD17660 [Gossypium barbadense]|nr:hypothetical protein GOBAR_DD17660 [Gossypium barbadense]
MALAPETKPSGLAGYSDLHGHEKQRRQTTELVVETDSLEAMELINNRTRMDVMVWEMMDRDWEVRVQFSPRIMNMAATLLQDCLGLRVLPAECYLPSFLIYQKEKQLN